MRPGNWLREPPGAGIGPAQVHALRQDDQSAPSRGCRANGFVGSVEIGKGLAACNQHLCHANSATRNGHQRGLLVSDLAETNLAFGLVPILTFGPRRFAARAASPAQSVRFVTRTARIVAGGDSLAMVTRKLKTLLLSTIAAVISLGIVSSAPW